MSLFAIVAGVAKYGAVISGTAFGMKVVDKVAPMIGGPVSSHVQPLLAGVGDTFLAVVDPLDFTGHRKSKADKRTNDVVAGMTAEVEKLASNGERQSTKLFQRAKTAPRDEVDILNGRAVQHARWAELARKTVAKSRTASTPQKARDLAAAAKDLAQFSVTPPQSALEVVAGEDTDAGKALVTSLVDSVNRHGAWDADAIVERMVTGDRAAFQEIANMSTPTIAGACCNNCSSGLSCDGSPRQSFEEIPDEYIDGSAHGGMSEMAGEDYVSGFLNAEVDYEDEEAIDMLTALSGPDMSRARLRTGIDEGLKGDDAHRMFILAGEGLPATQEDGLSWYDEHAFDIK